MHEASQRIYKNPCPLLKESLSGPFCNDFSCNMPLAYSILPIVFLMKFVIQIERMTTTHRVNIIFLMESI